MFLGWTLTNDGLQLLVADGDGAGSDQARGAEPHLRGNAVQVFPVQGSRQALPWHETTDTGDGGKGPVPSSHATPIPEPYAPHSTLCFWMVSLRRWLA